MEKKSPKPLRDYNLLITEELWEAHYQISLMILLKEFIKLNGKMSIITKCVKSAELNTKIVTAFLNMHILQII